MDQAVKTTIYQRLIALYYWYSMRHSLQAAGKANITSHHWALSCHRGRHIAITE